MCELLILQRHRDPGGLAQTHPRERQDPQAGEIEKVPPFFWGCFVLVLIKALDCWLWRRVFNCFHCNETWMRSKGAAGRGFSQGSRARGAGGHVTARRAEQVQTGASKKACALTVIIHPSNHLFNNHQFIPPSVH